MLIDPPKKTRTMPIRTSVEIASGNSIVSWILRKAKTVKETVRSAFNK